MSTKPLFLPGRPPTGCPRVAEPVRLPPGPDGFPNLLDLPLSPKEEPPNLLGLLDTPNLLGLLGPPKLLGLLEPPNLPGLPLASSLVPAGFSNLLGLLLPKEEPLPNLLGLLLPMLLGPVLLYVEEPPNLGFAVPADLARPPVADDDDWPFDGSNLAAPLTPLC